MAHGSLVQCVICIYIFHGLWVCYSSLHIVSRTLNFTLVRLFVRFLLDFDDLLILFRIAWWSSAEILAFRLCCFTFVFLSRIVSREGRIRLFHCLFIYYAFDIETCFDNMFRRILIRRREKKERKESTHTHS